MLDVAHIYYLKRFIIELEIITMLYPIYMSRKKKGKNQKECRQSEFSEGNNFSNVVTLLLY